MTKHKLKFVGLLCLFLFAIAAYKLYVQQQTSHRFTGTVEVTTADIMAKTNGYLDTLKIRDGDQVKKGDLIAILDRTDLTAQLLRDQAALAKAQAQLTDLVKGARDEERRTAAANVGANESLFEKADSDYRRAQALFAENAISKQQLDYALSAQIVAQNNLSAAKEQERLILAGNRADTIEAQRMEVERALAVLRLSEIAEKDKLIYTPLDGLVLRKNYEQGEYVNAGNAIATIANLADCWVKIYIPSAELGRVSVGQSVSVQIDAYPEKTFPGTIREISDSAEFTPRQSITKNERANLVFAVKIGLPNESNLFKPGMPADVTFDD